TSPESPVRRIVRHKKRRHAWFAARRGRFSRLGRCDYQIWGKSYSGCFSCRARSLHRPCRLGGKQGMFPAEPNDVMEAKIGAGGHGGDKFYFLSITVAGDRKRRRLARGGKAG